MKKDLQRKEQSALRASFKTIGIDLGDRWSRYGIVDEDGLYAINGGGPHP